MENVRQDGACVYLEYAEDGPGLTPQTPQDHYGSGLGNVMNGQEPSLEHTGRWIGNQQPKNLQYGSSYHSSASLAIEERPLMPRTPNIIIFGGTGSGKSSIINMIAGKPLAMVPSSVHGCTFQSTCYTVDIMNESFNIYDTAGLDEEDSAVSTNDAIVQLFRLLKSLDTGVNLLVFCMRDPRIKDAARKNWRLFHEIICRKQVPIVVAITGLENEVVMDEWWMRNKGAFQQYGMYPQGVGCITATRGRRLKSGEYMFDAEYEESKEKMWRLLKSHHLEIPWRTQPVEWFSTIVNVMYSSGSFLWSKTREHTSVETVVGPGIRQLVERCEMTEEEAKKLLSLLSRV